LPESRVRKSAAVKKKVRREVEVTERQRERRMKAPVSRRWVPPLFITVGLLGVFWLITYYIAGQKVPYMNMLGNWNILIGMGLMAVAFALTTLWK